MPWANDLATRRRLLHILAPEVKITRLIPARDAIIVITGSMQDADLIFSSGKHEKLTEDGFSALMPPTLRAQRSVVCTRLDDLVYEHDANEILDEVEKEQSWAKVQEVYKFPRTKNVKITFKTSDMAKKATETGLLMFCMSIPPSQVHQEEYIELITCNRCYAVEDHVTRLCNKPQGYSMCSNCAKEGHQHWECRTQERRCINCNEAHHATAMKCMVRKQALREKQNSLRQKRIQGATTTYAQATTTNGIPDSTGQHMTGLIEVSSNKNRQSQPKELARKNTLQVQEDSDGDSTSPAGSDSEDDHSDEEVNGLEVVIVKKNTDMWPRTRTFPHMERGVREGRYKIRHNLSASDYDLVIDRLRKMDRPVDHLLTSVRDAVFDTMPSGPFTSSEPSLKKRRGRKKKTQTA
ncbi:hypothetical protein O3P69_018653 [Scylla paramamosain]|uniref:Gag-like protein n=1 Tax=Scylla paramamosain TaxID=85552 RepID=A0AAW0SC94_SCYPA